MKNIYTSISIGIPAYNEELNIIFLINDLLKQKSKYGYVLDRIVIYSDGSNDNTIKNLKKIKNLKIIIIEGKTRHGKAFAQNKLINICKSDILILLDADIRIRDQYFIEKIISPIIKNNADLVASAAIEADPITFFEKIIYVSTKIKNKVYEEYNDGNNVYTCRGVARAFSKRLYENIKFTNSIGEDAYSYLYCIKNKYNYFFEKNAYVIFRLPNNFKDHENQSLKFFKSQSVMEKKFGKIFVKSNYNLPKRLLFKSLIINALKSPLFTFLYIDMLFFLKLKSVIKKVKINEIWQISDSSKVIDAQI